MLKFQRFLVLLHMRKTLALCELKRGETSTSTIRSPEPQRNLGHLPIGGIRTSQKAFRQALQSLRTPPLQFSRGARKIIFSSFDQQMDKVDRCRQPCRGIGSSCSHFRTPRVSLSRSVLRPGLHFPAEVRAVRCASQNTCLIKGPSSYF